MKIKIKTLKEMAALTIIVAAIGIIGAMDYADEQDYAAHCAEMVKAKAWPVEACK